MRSPIATAAATRDMASRTGFMCGDYVTTAHARARLPMCMDALYGCVAFGHGKAHRRGGLIDVTPDGARLFSASGRSEHAGRQPLARCQADDRNVRRCWTRR